MKIDLLVNEAAQHEEDDKKRREELEIRNSAEQLVYTIEKTLKEDADKVSELTRQEVQGDLIQEGSPQGQRGCEERR